MMRCPNCNSIDLGKIAEKQFYCWHCFIEIAEKGDKLEIYHVESDGTLTFAEETAHESKVVERAQ